MVAVYWGEKEGDVRIPKHLGASRAAGLLAVISAPAFAWIGWWQLGVSLGLAVLSALLAPVATRHGTHGHLRRMREALWRRMHPHAWRPGARH
jgi:hypothetical protein